MSISKTTELHLEWQENELTTTKVVGSFKNVGCQLVFAFGMPKCEGKLDFLWFNKFFSMSSRYVNELLYNKGSTA